jgi:hypothetical protein
MENRPSNIVDLHDYARRSRQETRRQLQILHDYYIGFWERGLLDMGKANTVQRFYRLEQLGMVQPLHESPKSVVRRFRDELSALKNEQV